ncbi:MAG TPA: DNRLRE domain-containing protein [Phycisphaerae bacterium]|nr:DNRLRE domain-containing protein [Phycisphaerae bacterium]HOJ74154.1 DNRLRE domain-containing protein [Phycisphaerae bacterium]HOM50748.1 DNRLRE domain-containing protein [Phycisphaerae bacterium]HOQ84667.1 DNRLRE domain-containing protein [Phycisphaerae bacterium]HPP26068.1 DNRLRE domain-containing protein [Phycisphaerae bacterium]
MARSVLTWIVSVVAACTSMSVAATILPEDDVTYRGATRYNNTNVFGMFTKGDGAADRGYIEFALGSEAASSAVLKLYNYWGAPHGKTVNATVRLRAISEDEPGYVTWTDTAGPAPSGTAHEDWTILVDSFAVDSTPQWYTFDITSFYNANLGEKVTISIRCLTNPAGDGPIFEDKENTGGTGMAPHIEWVPEPASLALLVMGSLMLARRRH